MSSECARRENAKRKPYSSPANRDHVATIARNNTDRRVVRTRRAILKALDELLAQQDASKITVSAIARKANIDRKTFYLHYSSLDDLFTQRSEEAVERLVAAIRESERQGTRKERVHETLTKVNAYLTANLDLCRNAFALFPTDAIVELFATAMRPAFESTGVDLDLANDEEFRMRMHFYFAGAIALYRAWVLSDGTKPIETVSDILERTLDTDALPELEFAD